MLVYLFVSSLTIEMGGWWRVGCGVIVRFVFFFYFLFEIYRYRCIISHFQQQDG